MRTKRGFSLVECMVCIVTLSTLTVTTLYCLKGYINHRLQRDEQITAIADNISTLEEIQAKLHTLEDLYQLQTDIPDIKIYNIAIEQAGQSGLCKITKDTLGNLCIEYNTYPTIDSQILAQQAIIEPTTFRIEIDNHSDVQHSKLDGIISVTPETKVGLSLTNEQATELGYLYYASGAIEADSSEYNQKICIIPQYIDGYQIININDFGFETIETIEYVYLPKTVTTVCALAFNECINIKAVKTAGQELVIGNYAFYSCNSLSDIDISKLTSIGAYAFMNCPLTETITINPAVTSLSLNSFAGCLGITNVDLSNTNITEIEDEVFNGCENIKTLLLPTGLKTIGTKAFNGCENIRNITIPNTVTTINTMAFANCTQLTQVFFADNVSTITINENIFSNCTSLQEIILPTNITIQSKAFANAGPGILTVYYQGNKGDWDVTATRNNNWNFYNEKDGTTNYKHMKYVQCSDGIIENLLGSNELWKVDG